MPNRLDSRDLAQYSFIAAIGSAGIVLLVLIIGLIPVDSVKILSNLAWLALPLSAAGLTMALLARTDFKRKDPGPEWWSRMRVGLRINTLTLAALLLLMLFSIVFPVILSALSNRGGF